MTSPSPAPPPTTDPTARAAIALARAETRRDMLEYLADWGMSLSKDICTRSIDSPYHPELKHDPGRSFASASRAVRLTLAMEERVEAYILALCNSVAPAAPPFVADPAAGRGAHGGESLRDEGPEPARETTERETGDVDEPRESREREWERLVEGEDFEAALAGDFGVCVEGVRRDLEAVSSSLPPVYGDGRLAEGERGGEVRVARKSGDVPHFPVPDYAVAACAPSVTAQERAPRHLPRKRTGEEFNTT